MGDEAAAAAGRAVDETLPVRGTLPARPILQGPPVPMAHRHAARGSRSVPALDSRRVPVPRREERGVRGAESTTVFQRTTIPAPGGDSPEGRPTP
mmetsp:Transcript_33907/g.71301  ORF Transcript_33907/g.71301 Transcript_33907/m.71301 type:complete len:95 (+) Transcript_33907:1076-1360(+)